MIGVVIDPRDHDVAAEFFELFKTPWERAVPRRRYRAVISVGDCPKDIHADVVLQYGADESETDRAGGVTVRRSDLSELTWGEVKLPVYRGMSTFDIGVRSLRVGGLAVDYAKRLGGRSIRRIGYDLFGEVRHLLTDGQPPAHAATPTLELHIEFVRQLLLESDVAFVEVPPCPAQHDFICCLTHDIDFFGIRRHLFDRTLAGFLVRGSIGTFVDLLRGRRSVDEATENWRAVGSLPLVFLGLCRDPWNPFQDYARTDAGKPSTYFLIPFRDRAGTAPGGAVEPSRAVRYQASDIGQEARQLMAGGHELAVHGIDAWRDTMAGRAELGELTALTSGKTAGVRMHWLYFDRNAPRRLETAGFEYDSTCGYNDAVGYRAGTSQVFRLPDTDLMELPLSIMDSALFYSKRMGLSRSAASQACRGLVVNARRYGGTLTINWHDRSLAPERLWGRFYRDLLAEIEDGQRAWFATASQAVEWFRWRRSLRFSVDARTGRATAATSAPLRAGLPAARIRVSRPALSCERQTEEYRFDGREAITVDTESVVSAQEM